MTKAKAWIFNGPGTELQMHEILLPALRGGEILVKNLYCTICKSDLHTFAGNRPGLVPSILGHEILGEIVQLPDLPVFDFHGNELSTGDLITWTLIAFCGVCRNCMNGMPQKCHSLKKYGHEIIEGHFKLTGGFASHTHLYPGTVTYKLPDNIDKRILAGLNCSWATVFAAMRMAGEIRGKNVLITGAGMLGLLSLIICKEMGAANIVICEKDNLRLGLTRIFGAGFMMPGCKETFIHEKIKEYLNGEQVDVIFEMTGANSAVELAIEIAGVGTSVVLAGSVTPVENIEINPEKIVRKLLQIKGIHNYTPDDLARAIDFLKEIHNKYPLELLFDDTLFGLQNIDKALIHAMQSSFHRVVIEMD